MLCERAQPIFHPDVRCGAIGGVKVALSTQPFRRRRAIERAYGYAILNFACVIALGNALHLALGGLRAVDLVGAAFEGGGETAEGGVEDRAHEQTERAAAELIGEEKINIADVFFHGAEIPPVVEPAKRSFEVLNQDF
jgi:hypothetical protein